MRLALFNFRQTVDYRLEILSGLTVAMALIPEAVAFAFIAGLSPLTGLYAAFVVGLVASVLGGRPGYEVTEGSVTFDGVDLLELEPHERAAAGVFLGFQYPVEIPGVSNVQFLRESLNAQRAGRGEKPLSGGEFLKLAREEARKLDMDAEMLKRPVNVGFSGGEKKRNEMVQMGIIDPKFAILDETDSGLDIDALRIVGDGINRIMRKPEKAVLLITHYQRLLEVVKPDKVSILSQGRIVQTGGPELAVRLEEEGYDAVMAA